MQQSQIDALLSLAAQKTGKDPAEIRQQMESGQTEALLGNMPADKKAQVNALLSDPKAMEAFMNRPQVQALIKALGGGGVSNG